MVDLFKSGDADKLTKAGSPATRDIKVAPGGEGSNSSPSSPEKLMSGRDLEKRANKEAGYTLTEKGTMADSLYTQGLATCFGVAVIFNAPFPGVYNKVMSHLRPAHDQVQLNRLRTTVADVWVRSNQAQNAYHMSLPDHNSMVQDMINSGSIPQSQAQNLFNTMAIFEGWIINEVEQIARTTTLTPVDKQRRAPGMRGYPFGRLEIMPDNTVLHEGYIW